MLSLNTIAAVAGEIGGCEGLFFVAIDSLLLRAEHAFLHGELWRAKEILQGGIRTHGYEPVLFERYGLVLLKMGDLLEAGKYLFLSGRREPIYEQAISLFLGRFTHANPLQLYSTFPRKARLPRRNDYPAPVNAELEQLGFPEELPASHKVILPVPETIATEVRALSCFAVIAVVLGLSVLGIIHVVQWFQP